MKYHDALTYSIVVVVSTSRTLDPTMKVESSYFRVATLSDTQSTNYERSESYLGVRNTPTSPRSGRRLLLGTSVLSHVH
jgi:hypothetical protein